MSIRVVSRGVAATRHLGRSLGRMLAKGDLVVLKGRFGSGKTTFTQGVARGLGIVEPVVSPSFTLVNEYRTPRGIKLYHIDLYRVSGSKEALGFGLDEYLNGEGICVIEWPEPADELLPAERLEIAFEEQGATARAITFSAKGARFTSLVAAFAAQAGLARAGPTGVGPCVPFPSTGEG